MKDLIVALLTMLPAVAAGVYRWPKINGYPRLLLVQVVVATVINVVATGVSNHALFNLFMVLDFYLVFTAGYPYYKRFRTFSLYQSGCFLFALVWLVSVICRGINTLATYALVCGSLIVSVAYLYVLMHLFLEREEHGTNGLTLIYLGTFIYCCCSIPVFSFLYFLSARNMTGTYQLYDINQILASVRYVLIAVGFLKLK